MSEDKIFHLPELNRSYGLSPPPSLNSVNQLDSLELVQDQKRIIPNYEELWREHCTKYPTTAQCLDQLPTKPVEGNSEQRVAQNNRKHTLQMILYVTSHVVLKEHQPISKWDEDELSKREHIKSIWPDAYFKHLMGKREKLKGFDSVGSEMQLVFEQKKSPIFSFSLSLADFRPLRAPFVPDLIKQLVNLTEAYCYKTDWRKVYEPLTEYQTEARNRLIHLLDTGNENDRKLLRALGSLNGPVAISMLRIFLSTFTMKPLHFSTALVQELVQRPLFDHFLRPNPRLRGLVQCAAIPQSRTHLDTLAFLMVHILHALDNNPDPIDGKMRLCNLYGPLLISFTERPQLCRFTQGNARSEEAALLDVILEVCDLPFWNHMSMLKLPTAFAGIPPKEKKQAATGSLPPDQTEEQFYSRKSNKILPEHLDSFIINEILRSVQTVASSEGQSDLLPSFDPESRAPLPKRYCALSPISIAQCNRQHALSMAGSVTTLPKEKIVTLAVRREKTKNGRYLSVFQTQGDAQFYSTGTLLEESRLYRMGRIVFPDRKLSMRIQKAEEVIPVRKKP
ncbi:hypothetical protein D915_001511 [Fasciola hepatica]|uniref:Rho-GAP domain-containing protein n=1 Tax=Fasciola hepatica TaxID=6192 RepID=A0A4E0RYX7_FASHE|nr:hypothetical protein D915_001511 [Fasciola hepatica]